MLLRLVLRYSQIELQLTRLHCDVMQEISPVMITSGLIKKCVLKMLLETYHTEGIYVLFIVYYYKYMCRLSRIVE